MLIEVHCLACKITSCQLEISSVSFLAFFVCFKERHKLIFQSFGSTEKFFGNILYKCCLLWMFKREPDRSVEFQEEGGDCSDLDFGVCSSAMVQKRGLSQKRFLMLVMEFFFSVSLSGENTRLDLSRQVGFQESAHQEIIHHPESTEVCVNLFLLFAIFSLLLSCIVVKVRCHRYDSAFHRTIFDKTSGYQDLNIRLSTDEFF